MTPRPGAPELRIDPEPTLEEREAIAQALASVTVPPAAYRSTWRRSGAPCSEQDGLPELHPAGS